MANDDHAVIAGNSCLLCIFDNIYFHDDTVSLAGKLHKWRQSDSRHITRELFAAP